MHNTLFTVNYFTILRLAAPLWRFLCRVRPSTTVVHSGLPQNPAQGPPRPSYNTDTQTSMLSWSAQTLMLKLQVFHYVHDISTTFVFEVIYQWFAVVCFFKFWSIYI